MKKNKYYEYKNDVNKRGKRKMTDAEVILLAAQYLNNEFTFETYELIYPNSIKHSTVGNYLRSRLESIDKQLFDMIDRKLKS